MNQKTFLRGGKQRTSYFIILKPALETNYDIAPEELWWNFKGNTLTTLSMFFGPEIYLGGEKCVNTLKQSNTSSNITKQVKKLFFRN